MNRVGPLDSAGLSGNMDPSRDVQFVNEVLRNLHALFRNCLDFQSISPHLRSHNLLTDNEWEVISRKDSRGQQVDEFLQCLPHKGRNCLSQLIKCLQLSPEHSGHQDLLTELNKLVEKQTNQVDNPTAEIFKENNSQNSVQNGFEKAISDFANVIKSLHSSETKILEQKLEQQNAEIKRLQDRNEDLKQTISDLQDSNESLRMQLQERESISETFESDALEDDSYTSCVEETFAHNNRVGSLSSIYSSSPNTQTRQKRCHSDLKNQHSEVYINCCIEDKMKTYQEKLKTYHSKCQSLQAEKKLLKDEKRQLEWEVSSLKQQLDNLSIASYCSSLSHHKLVSQSCSSFYEIGLANKAKVMQESDKSAAEPTSTSYFSRFASIVKVKRPSARVASLESQEMINKEMSNSGILPNYANYLTNAIYQGWLTKEGGLKKILRKRWCILSSHCFLYFEKEEDLKRPLGILYLTSDMEVTDSVKENWFEIFNKSETNMNSCKLDKSRNIYVRGNHASYYLQASCDDEKKKWIEAFQKVLESLDV